MRLIVHGQQAFGAALLQGILDKGVDEVIAVYCAPDEDDVLDPLKSLALDQGIDVLQPSTFKDPAVWEQIAGLKADLCVMCWVTLFVPEEALNAPKFGSIQYHPSLLPDHKGPSAINWPIIMGKAKTGISVFWPDNGFDTGPVLMQTSCNIADDDTVDSLYLDHLFPMGIASMLEAVDLVRDGSAARVPQDIDAGSYESWCTDDDAQIDWSRPGAEVYNLVRGCNRAPGAWSLFEGEMIRIYDCRLGEHVDALPGTLVAMSDRDITIALVDASLKVERVAYRESSVQSAATWYQTTPGARLNDVFGGTELDSQSA